MRLIKYSNNQVGAQLYRIILSKNFDINNPPPVYDYTAYNKIISNYKYPSNIMTPITFYGSQNTTIVNKIKTNYQGIIYFAIQRVFYSPTDDTKEIISNLSTKIQINIVNNIFPAFISISSFQTDQTINGLTTFFRPKATIVYFYKFINEVSAYRFAGPDINVPSSSLNIKNNATSITEPTITINDLSTVEKDVTNNFQITLVNRYKSDFTRFSNHGSSDLTSNTSFPFGDLFTLL